MPKVLFNVPFATALYATATHHEQESVAWAVALLAYPLNTFKTIMQVSSKEASRRITASLGLYRGFLPFALVNYLCAYNLTALYSPEKLASLRT